MEINKQMINKWKYKDMTQQKNKTKHLNFSHILSRRVMIPLAVLSTFFGSATLVIMQKIAASGTLLSTSSSIRSSFLVRIEIIPDCAVVGCVNFPKSPAYTFRLCFCCIVLWKMGWVEFSLKDSTYRETEVFLNGLPNIPNCFVTADAIIYHCSWGLV